MDFSDERYVRLYVRDTPTWLSWPWEARAVHPSLLRKLDRSGRVEWPTRLNAVRAIAAVVSFPEAVVETALEAMLETETITLGPGWLEVPNFVVGQNCRSKARTSAERTAEWKEKVGYPTTRAERTAETRGDESSPVETVEPLSSAQLSSAQEQISEPIGSSVQTSAEAELGTGSGGAGEGALVLIHPTAEETAGSVASQRRRAAIELWTWHEAQRTSRLLGGHHPPRQHTDKSLRHVMNLQGHIRKAYGCTEAEAWQRVRDYREARIAQVERAMLDNHSEADKWLRWCANKTAWSTNAFDGLSERGPDPREAKAAADAEFAAEVQRIRDERRQQGGSGA